MLGSTTFAAASRKLPAEDLMAGMLVLATLAMCAATFIGVPSGGLVPLVAAFFAFEYCVGMYFPLIGTLRSKYLPDAYRGVIMCAGRRARADRGASSRLARPFASPARGMFCAAGISLASRST